VKTVTIPPAKKYVRTYILNKGVLNIMKVDGEITLTLESKKKKKKITHKS